MKNWKKAIGMLSLAAFALTGCSHSAKPSTGNTSTGTENTGQQANQQAEDTHQKSQTLPNKTTDLVVSAAVSLKDSLEQIQGDFEKEHPDIRITYNFGSSGMLEQQIKQGSNTDLFLSAGEKQMQDLIANHMVDQQAECDLLQNQLVLITPKNGASLSSLDVLGRPDIKKIAVGQPDSVPAGLYAKQSLSYYKEWNDLQSKLVFAKDVRQVLSYVETGDVDAGFVYKTDALTSNRVQVSLDVDSKSHDSILYPVGVVSGSKHFNEAKTFYEYLQGSDAKQVFEKSGFNALK